MTINSCIHAPFAISWRFADYLLSSNLYEASGNEHQPKTKQNHPMTKKRNKKQFEILLGLYWHVWGCDLCGNIVSHIQWTVWKVSRWSWHLMRFFVLKVSAQNIFGIYCLFNIFGLLECQIRFNFFVSNLLKRFHMMQLPANPTIMLLKTQIRMILIYFIIFYNFLYVYIRLYKVIRFDDGAQQSFNTQKNLLWLKIVNWFYEMLFMFLCTCFLYSH